MDNILIGSIWHKVPDGYEAIYCGRNGLKNKGAVKYNLGNPYASKKHGLKECLVLYKDYLDNNLHLLLPLQQKLSGGSKLALVCFCTKASSFVEHNDNCHCQIIKDTLDETIY